VIERAAIGDSRAVEALTPDFKAHLLGGPKVDAFDVPRDRDVGRAVEPSVRTR